MKTPTFSTHLADAFPDAAALPKAFEAAKLIEKLAATLAALHLTGKDEDIEPGVAVLLAPLFPAPALADELAEIVAKVERAVNAPNVEADILDEIRDAVSVFPTLMRDADETRATFLRRVKGIAHVGRTPARMSELAVELGMHTTTAIVRGGFAS